MQRVEILGLRRGGGLCCGEERKHPTLKRDYPSILHRTNTNVSQQSWLSFCDQIDEALKSITEVKAQAARMVMILIGLVAVAVIGSATLITQTPIEKYLGKLWYFYIFSVVYLVPCVLFFRIRGTISRNMGRVYDEVHAICLNTSNQFSAVTFELTIIRRTNGKKIWYDRYITIQTDDQTNSTGSLSVGTPDDNFNTSPIEAV